MTDHLQKLAPGFRLCEYEIREVLGSDEIGFKYLCFDHNLREQVAILEYLPSSVATRYGPASVMPSSSAVETRFHQLLGQFLDEAGALTRFRHPNIVHVRRVLQTNGTGYIVMDYAQGNTLSEILRRSGKLGNEDLDQFLPPILDALGEFHSAEFLHQDIRPGTIVIREDRSPLLLAAGAIRQGSGISRQLVGDDWKNRHAALPPSVYAPIEMHSNSASPGPWTDIYSLGATLYHCVTGSVPPAAPERTIQETIAPLSEEGNGSCRPGILAGIDAALAIRPRDRPRSIPEWREILSGKSSREHPHTPALGNGSERIASRGVRLSADAGAGDPRARSGRQPWIVASLALTGATAFVVYLDAGILRPLKDGSVVSNPPPPLVANSLSSHSETEALGQPDGSDPDENLGRGEAILVVETEPPDAEVFVAGQLVGETPLRLAGLPSGVFDITLRHPYHDTVELADQAFESLKELRIEQTMDRATGGLIVTTEPAGAWVELDGRRIIQRTPGTARSLPAGPVRLTLGADGHRQIRVLGEVPNGGMGYLSHTLRRDDR